MTSYKMKTKNTHTNVLSFAVFILVVIFALFFSSVETTFSQEDDGNYCAPGDTPSPANNYCNDCVYNPDRDCDDGVFDPDIDPDDRTPAPGGDTGVQRPTDFQSFVGLILNIISLLILVIFSLTLVVFIWGIVKNWIIRGADPEGVQEGKKVVMVGITALVIMVSIWGILYLLQRSLFG